MERRDTEIVRDDVTGTVHEESRVTRDTGAGPITDSAEVVSSVAPTRRAIEVCYLVFGIIDGLLLIRLVLKLLGANPLAGFSSFVYGLTDVFLAPFRNLLPVVGGSSGAVLEMSVVIAIIVYALVADVLAKIVAITFSRGITASHRTSSRDFRPRSE